jgi:hypothetical protein
MKHLLISALICVALAACGGGSSTTPPATKPATNGVGQLSFSILVPASTTPAAARRPAYVSPSTRSASFQINSGTPQVIALTPGSATCPSSPGGYTCTATANVAAGAAQLMVATYASTDGTGSALSENTLAVTIVADQSNPVTVTLNGIAVTFTLVANPTSVTEGTPGSFSVTWTALDASGNTIVGPGSIVNGNGNILAPALVVSDPTDFAISSPVGNAWTVSYDGAVTSSPVTFRVANTDVIAASTTVSVTAIGQRLFVANSGTNDSASVYNPPYTGTPTIITNGVGGNQAPFYIAANANNTVTMYAPPYTGAPTVTIAVTTPRDVAVDANGNLFVSSGSGVEEFAPPYTGSATATITSGLNSPYSIALDGFDDLFVQNAGNNTVSVFVPPYTAAPTVISAPGCVPNCFDQVGEQIATIPGTSEVVFPNDAYPTAGFASPYLGSTPTFSIANGTNNGSWGIAINAGGDIFIAYTASSTVAEYQPPYTGGATVTISTGVDQPRGISLDTSGNLFVSNINDTVTEYAPPYTGAPVTINTVGGGTIPFSTALSP